MSFWRPQPSPSRLALFILPVLCIALAVWMWALIAARVPVVVFDVGVFLLGLEMFLALMLAGMLAYMGWCVSTMRYRLDDEAVTVRCGGVKYIVPLESIIAVYAPGESVGGEPISVIWKRTTPPLPGYVIGSGISMQLGNVISVATRPPAEQVFIGTREAAFGISPQSGLEFVSQLNRKLKLADRDEELDEQVEYSGEGTYLELSGISARGAALWADPLARPLLITGLLICAAIFLYLGFVYGSLPTNLLLHWNALGQPDRVGDPIELMRLPAFALGIWLVNAVVAWAVRPRERAATLFLLGGAVAVQVVFAAAVLSIVLRS
ncbi:MAG TPA: PH domain-containing protein [Chloroflexia bacterium]|nr:PH domain-containing protein [Chloroflexia bacterium]